MNTETFTFKNSWTKQDIDFFWKFYAQGKFRNVTYILCIIGIVLYVIAYYMTKKSSCIVMAFVILIYFLSDTIFIKQIYTYKLKSKLDVYVLLSANSVRIGTGDVYEYKDVVLSKQFLCIRAKKVLILRIPDEQREDLKAYLQANRLAYKEVEPFSFSPYAYRGKL